MGKITDALEKSRNNRENKLPETHPIRMESKSKKNRKVVPLDSASVFDTKGDLDKKLVTYYSPQSLEAEVFRILRTNVLFPSSGSTPRTIMVTSAMPGEGKSFVSSNLAISIARGIEEHVLLMDCDMRNPTIHKMFGYRETQGLSEYLAKGVELPKLLRKTPIKKLTLLPGGEMPPNPTELLSSIQMAKLLSELKSRYEDRYIIIDSPPPQLTAETSALARRVDGIIVVVRAGSTNKNLVRDMIDNIGKEKIIGVVMNNFKPPFSKYKGYGSYGKYTGEE